MPTRLLLLQIDTSFFLYFTRVIVMYLEKNTVTLKINITIKRIVCV